jgi:hypothetical protein
MIPTIESQSLVHFDGYNNDKLKNDTNKNDNGNSDKNHNNNNNDDDSATITSLESSSSVFSDYYYGSSSSITSSNVGSVAAPFANQVKSIFAQLEDSPATIGVTTTTTTTTTTAAATSIYKRSSFDYEDDASLDSVLQNKALLQEELAMVDALVSFFWSKEEKSFEQERQQQEGQQQQQHAYPTGLHWEPLSPSSFSSSSWHGYTSDLITTTPMVCDSYNSSWETVSRNSENPQNDHDDDDDGDSVVAVVAVASSSTPTKRNPGIPDHIMLDTLIPWDVYPSELDYDDDDNNANQSNKLNHSSPQNLFWRMWETVKSAISKTFRRGATSHHYKKLHSPRDDKDDHHTMIECFSFGLFGWEDYSTTTAVDETTQSILSQCSNQGHASCPVMMTMTDTTNCGPSRRWFL